MRQLILIVFIPFGTAYAATPAVTEGDTQTFLGPVRVAGEIYQWMYKILGTAQVATTEPITMYVETTGSDTSGDGLSVGTAFKTIGHALAVLPKNIKDNVTINVGEGNFDGFMITNFSIDQNAYLTVQGRMGTILPATGTSSGTADAAGGSTSLLVDSGQTWTVNNLRGSFLHIGTEYRPIMDNTATSITVVGTFSATCNNKAYTIEEPKTVINTNSPYLSSTRIFVAANCAPREGIKLTYLKTSGGSYGVYCRDMGVRIDILQSLDAVSSGFLFQAHMGEGRIYDVVVKISSGVYGVAIIRSAMANVQRVLVYDSAVTYPIITGNSTFGTASDWTVVNIAKASCYGIYIQSSGAVSLTGITTVKDLTLGSIGVGVFSAGLTGISNLQINNISGGHGFGLYCNTPGGHILIVAGSITNLTDGIILSRGATLEITNVTITDNDRYGIAVQNAARLIMWKTGAQTIGSNGDGIYVGTSSYALLQNTDGTNTGYGIIVESGAQVVIDTATGVTGSTGDILLDDVAKTYVGNFSSDKDTEIGVFGSRAQRYDGLDYNY